MEAQAARAGAAAGAAAGKGAETYTWSNAQISAVVLLAVFILLAILYGLAVRRDRAYQRWLDAEPGRRAKHEKAMKKKVSGPVD
jgi:hypothetical protein